MASNNYKDDDQNYNSWARPSILNVFDLPNMSRTSSEEYMMTGYGNGRASIASSYVDDEDESSDTTSCNDEPISYDNFVNESRRSSQFTDGTIGSGKSHQGVEFREGSHLYNSLVRKYDSMDIRKKKQKNYDEKLGGDDSGNGTDWKSDTGSISGAKFIQTPLCDNEDDDEVELSQGTWDIFQTIPRERQSSSESSLKILKFIKVLMYGFLFVMVLGTAVISKFSFIILTTNAGINRIQMDYENLAEVFTEFDDPTHKITPSEKINLASKYEQMHNEIRNTSVTLLVIALLIPEAIVFLSHFFKSVFGSQPWPTMRIIMMSLIVSGLETFGHCLLVFKVLPSIDMVRGVMLLSCIGFLPGITRLIFGKENRHSNWIITKRIILIIAVIVQLTGPIAVLILSYGWREATPEFVSRFIEKSHSLFVRDPAKWTLNSMNQLALNYEVILALLLPNLSWCENFLEKNRIFAGKNVNVCKLKSILHSVRQKTYAFLPLWKGLLIICFVYALIPDFRMGVIRMDFKNRTDPDKMAGEMFERKITAKGELFLEKLQGNLTNDISSLGNTGHKNMTEALKKAMEKVYVAKNAKGLDKHPKGYLDFPTDPINNMAQAFKQMYTNAYESGDEYRGYAYDTLDALLDIKLFSQSTRKTIMDFKDFIKESEKPGHLVWEYCKQYLEQFWCIILLVFGTIFCSYFAKLSCKLCMQFAGFSVPLLLAGPVTTMVLYLQCSLGFLPSYNQWICMETDRSSFMFYVAIILGILWWVSQMIITSHIWVPCKERLARTDKLFVVPGISMTLVEQCLLYNRRRNDSEVIATGVDNHIDYIGPGSAMLGESCTSINSKKLEEIKQQDYVVPKIHVVATMWHETRNEMTQLLKSVFRMDSDQSARRNAQKYFGIRDPDYYEFEAHILFDDAMEINDEEEKIPNSFVVTLCEVIDLAASSIHETAVTVPPPTRIPTPYGGQLKWTLPGGTILTAHVKDKDKIRHKKRWSQVMYMYYLLGYKLICEDDDYSMRTLRSGPGKHISWAKSATKSQKRRKTTHYTKSDIFDVMGEDFHIKSENTFLLTLDGDVDFKPDAVRLLMDRMKKNKKVGAACGRIHPIGSGPLIWYQRFEYACGHWLQKAAEHVFGCVLCAPGCFSLFRGSALMDDNVMNTYTTQASKAAEFVQFDQGEDRWLCTLLLQQGYRVEYCAASDALTYAPEQFNEFYNQRRRWGPSTMANIIDLLSDSSNTVMVNDNISKIYLIYQFAVFASSILGPATVMLMTAGAYHTVFRVNIYWSYGMALLLPAIFVITCLVLKSSLQLIIAAVFSAFYAVIMMVVLVGTAINFVFEGWTSPNVIFIMLLLVVYIVAAILHPQEMFCMLYGPLYFLCIPSGYLLLTIYFLCNLHVISWGTREVQVKKTKAQLEQEEKERIEAEKKKKESRLLTRLGVTKMIEDLKELFATMTGFRQQVNQSENKQTELLIKMCQTLDNLPDRISGKSQSSTSQKIMKSVEVQCNTNDHMIPDNKLNEVIEHTEEIEKPKRPPRDDLRNPAWLEDERLGDGPIMYINKKEAVFWKQLISRYLYPIVMDKDQKKRLSDELLALRNNVVFAFFMMNFLWIVVVFQFHLLQSSMNQDLFDKNGGSQLRNCSRMLENGLFIPIPRTDGTCVGIEPLSFVFLLLFTIILLTQFIGMFIHRWGTFLHLIAITQIKWPWSRKMGDLTTDTNAAIELVQQLQKIKDLDPLERYNGDTDGSSIYSLSTVDQSQAGTATEADSEIVKPRTRRPKRNGHLSLDRVFRKRFHKLKKELEVDVATDAESSNEGGEPSDEPKVGNKVYRSVRARLAARRTASFSVGQRQRRGSAEIARQPRFHDI